MRIVLDANFLIDLARFKIGLESMAELVGSHKLVTIDSVVVELDKISGKRTKSSLYAKVALELMKEYRIDVLKTDKRQTDKALMQLANEEDTIVATNDRRLRIEIKASGRKTIYLKSKKHLAIG